VAALDDHAHGLRFQHFHQRVGDLDRQALLHLQALGKHVDETRQLRQSDDLAVRQIAHRRLAEERRQVVFAMTVDRNAAHDDQFVVFLGAVFERLEDLDRILVVAGSPVFPGLGDTRGRLVQTGAVGIFAKAYQQAAPVVLGEDFFVRHG
jgi:hypothetical protein